MPQGSLPFDGLQYTELFAYPNGLLTGNGNWEDGTVFGDSGTINAGQLTTVDADPHDNLQAVGVAALDFTRGFMVEVTFRVIGPVATSNEANVVVGDINAGHLQLFWANAMVGSFAGKTKLELYSDAFTPRIVSRVVVTPDVDHTIQIWLANDEITLCFDGVPVGNRTPYPMSHITDRVIQIANDVINTIGAMHIKAIKVHGPDY